MSILPFLALPHDLEVTAFSQQEGTLCVGLQSTQPSSCCPLCGAPATRVHSRYQRKLADLPCTGQPLCFQLSVRKFFCEESACPRKIFVERLPAFVAPWARVTTRLYQIVQIIGLATGSRLGIRVTDRLGIQTCRMTILRRIMTLPPEPVGPVSQIGIDDFSFRRGRKFGTIIVDLQTHHMLDVLADRTTTTSAAWMQTHPELKMVSRDRAGEYAAAARKSAPQATQIADRFHMYKNLTEAVELALARCRAEIRKNAEEASRREVSLEARQALVERTKAFSVKTWKPTPDHSTEQARLTRRAQRYDRYQQVVALHAQGFEQAEIAHRVGLSTRTLQKWLKAGTFPEAKQRRKRQSTFDPYAAFVLRRWQEGCKKGSQLYREIKAQGYTGTERQVYRFLLPSERNYPSLKPLRLLKHLSKILQRRRPSGFLCAIRLTSMRRSKQR